jgi:hypothetical protein
MARKTPEQDRTGKSLQVWIPAELKDALDSFVNASRPKTSLTSCVEVAIEDFLKQHGAWPPPAKPANGSKK